MILRASMRTDIPAFYSEWFFRRLQAGSLCVRNPRAPGQVTRYRLSPQVVDLFVFCTKTLPPCWNACLSSTATGSTGLLP